MPDQSTPVRMIAPDGQTYTVPMAGYTKALDNGWKTEDPSQQHALLQQVIPQEEAAKGLAGSLEAGGKSFLNQALLGVPEIIGEHTKTDLQKEEDELREAEHPVARTIGGVAGFGTSLAYGGEVADAVGQVAERAVGSAIKEGAAQKILASAAKGAAEAGTFSAPSAVAQAAYGDRETAAETMLVGIGAGGVLGGALGGTKVALKGASDLADRVIGEGGLGEKADEMALGQNEINGPDARKLGKNKLSDMAQFLQNEGQYGNKVSRQTFQDIADQAGGKIGDFNNLDKEVSAYQAPTDITSSVAPPTKLGVPVSDAISTISNKVREAFPMIDSPLGTSAKNELDKIIDTIVSSSSDGDRLSFATSQDIKTTLGKAAKWDQNVSNEANAVRKLAYSTFSDLQEAAVDKAFQTLDGNGDRMADYLKQKFRYKNAMDFLAKGPQEATNGFGVMSPSNGLTGLGARLVGSHIGGLIGGPVGTAVGWVATPLLKRLAEERGLPFAIRGMKKLAEEGSPFLGSALAKSGKDALDNVLKDIPQHIVKGMKVAPLAAINPIKTFLGDNANGLSKDQQYKKATDLISQSVTNPTYITNEIAKLYQTFGDDTQLANLIAKKHFDAIDYLYQAMPKNTGTAQPFQKDNWKPTPQEKRVFLQKLAVVDNPLVAVHKIGNNTITSGELEALRTVYPKIAEHFTTAITQAGYQPNAKKLTLEKKVVLSKVLGQPLDPSLKPDNMARIQKVFSMPNPEQNNQGTPSQGHPSKMTGPNLSTNTQRLQEKGLSK